MIRLQVNKEPRWLALLGGELRVQIKPVTSAIVMAARIEAVKAVTAPEAGQPMFRFAGERTAEFIKALGRMVIVDWEGVGMKGGEDKAPVTPVHVDALLDEWTIAEEFQLKAMADADLLDAEKNGSGAALNGTTASAQNTAETAAQATPPAAEASPA